MGFLSATDRPATTGGGRRGSLSRGERSGVQTALAFELENGRGHAVILGGCGWQNFASYSHTRSTLSLIYKKHLIRNIVQFLGKLRNKN